jgi:hypothetical protein
MKNDKNFSVFKSDNYITIGSNRFNEFLRIDISSLKLKYITEMTSFGKKIADCYGIIGIITLIDNTYLITISEARCILSFCKREIYKVVNTEFIPFIEKKEDLELISDLITLVPGKNKEAKTEEEEIIDNLKLLYKTGFYFSNKFDLANSLSSQQQIMNAKKASQSSTDYDYIVDGNHYFLANYKLAKKLIINNPKNCTRIFLSNCIYGNVEQFKFENSDDTIQIIIISRRNIINYGLSNFKKGLIKEGNSNFIETELIVVQNNYDIFSSVFLSSYLPLFFKKNKEQKMVELFDKSFKNLLIEYNLLIMLLLQEGNYDYYIDAFKQLIHYKKEDYGKLWKYFGVDNNEKHILKILENSKGHNLIDIIGFTHFDSHLKILKDHCQIGSFILFGIDDKIMTKNQMYLAYKMIYEMYSHFEKKDTKFLNILKENINLESNFEGSYYNGNQLLSGSTIKNFSFLDYFTHIFYKRSAELSPQYFYNQNIEKAEKRQRLLDLIFNKEKRTMTIKEEVDSLREEFAIFSNIIIYVATWNTGCTNLSVNTELSLDSWLMPKNEKIVPNIYLIGLQEVVELNAANVMSNNNNKQNVLRDWGIKIEKTLQKVGQYRKLIEMNLVGINLYFYVLESEVDNINNLTKLCVKTGLGGHAGNKGSCCLHFNYLSTSISVACSHLAAGIKHNKQRLKELTYILNLKTNEFKSPSDININIEEDDDDSFDSEGDSDYNSNTNTPTLPKKRNKILKSSNTFCDSDIWIIFGDLNFRIDMEYEEFSNFVKNSESWSKLLDYDQFNKNKFASLKLMEMVEEDTISHQPTYKFIVGSDSYDYTHKNKNKNNVEGGDNNNKSKKQRNPSWCDRIFYKKNTYETPNYGKLIKGTEYNNVMDGNYQTSDHRPIYNIFDVIVFQEDKAKRSRIEKEVESNEILGINSKYFKSPNFNL